MIVKELFGRIRTGQRVYNYTLSNESKVSAVISEFGATIIKLIVKDKNGNDVDVVCGYDNIYGYLNAKGYQGAVVGRVANRISNSKFTLDGIEYELYSNDGNNSLHGGKVGFSQKLWSIAETGDGEEPYIVLEYVSPHLEENYPGTLTTRVTYKLTAKGGLSIRYEAVTDKNTIINLTNHSYFNLAGCGNGTIKNQIMWLDADKINEVDSKLIPTGNFINVEGTGYDFRTPKAIGRDFDSEPAMVLQNGGYDTNYIINGYDGEIKLIASLEEPENGIKMKVYTNQPCIQIYTANMIDEEDVPFKGIKRQKQFCAVCFETQHMPDAINHPVLHSIVLKPEEKYDYTTVYEFE